MGGGASRRQQGGKAGKAAASSAPLSDTLRRRRRVLLGSDSPEPQPFELLPPLQQFEKFPQAAPGPVICGCGNVLKDGETFCRGCGIHPALRPPEQAVASDFVFDRVGINMANDFRRRSHAKCNVDGYLGSSSIELLGLDIITGSALSNRLFSIGQVGRSMPAPQPVAAAGDEAPKPLDGEHDPRAPRPPMLTCYELLALFTAIRAGSKDDLLELLFCIFDVDEDDRVSMEDFEATIAAYLELVGANGLQGAELQEYKRMDPNERTSAARRIAELAIAKYSCGVELPPPDPSAPDACTDAVAAAYDGRPAPGGVPEQKAGAPEASEKEASAEKEDFSSFEARGNQALNTDDTGHITKVAKGSRKGKPVVQVGWQITLIDDQPFGIDLFKQKQADGEDFRMTLLKVKPPRRKGMCSCFGGGRKPAADKQDPDDKKRPLIAESSDSEGVAGSWSDEGHKQDTKKKEDAEKARKQKRRSCCSWSPRRKANQSEKPKEERHEEQSKLHDEDEGIEAAAETEGATKKTEAVPSQGAKTSNPATPKVAPKKRRGSGCIVCCGGKKKTPAKPQPLTFEQWKKWFLENFGEFEFPESLGTAPVDQPMTSHFAGPADKIGLPQQDVVRDMIPQDVSAVRTLLPQDMMTRNLPPQHTIPPAGLAPRGAPVGASTGIRHFEDDVSSGDAEAIQCR